MNNGSGELLAIFPVRSPEISDRLCESDQSLLGKLPREFLTTEARSIGETY
jgi:hypothetical protein